MSKEDTREEAGLDWSIRASDSEITRSKQGQSGRAVVVGESMERCEAVGDRSSYDSLVSVNLHVRYPALF